MSATTSFIRRRCCSSQCRARLPIDGFPAHGGRSGLCQRRSHRDATADQHPDEGDQDHPAKPGLEQGLCKPQQSPLRFIDHRSRSDRDVRLRAVGAAGAGGAQFHAVGAHRLPAVPAAQQGRSLWVPVAEHLAVDRGRRGDGGHFNAAPGAEAGVVFVLLAAPGADHARIVSGRPWPHPVPVFKARATNHEGQLRTRRERRILACTPMTVGQAATGG